VDYLGNIEDYKTVVVYEVCDCKECEEYAVEDNGGCMIMCKK